MLQSSDCVFFFTIIPHMYSRIVGDLDMRRFEIEEYHAAAWILLVK